MAVMTLLENVKANLILEHSEDDELLEMYIAAAFFLLYNNLLVNAFFQFGNVRDNTHKQIALCQIVQDFQSLRQSILIKRSEALINKHCNLPPPKRPTAIVSSPVEADKQTVTKISPPSVL